MPIIKKGGKTIHLPYDRKKSDKLPPLRPPVKPHPLPKRPKRVP